LAIIFLHNAINNGLGNLSVQTLTLDPSDAATIYAGTAGGGVFKSSDGGDSWSATGLTNAYVRSLVVDPGSPSTVYAATASGMYKSTNAGSSWVFASAGLPSGSSCYGLAIDPTTPSTLYTSLSYRSGVYTIYGVYKTTNGGASWSSVSFGGRLTHALVFDAGTPSTIYAATSSGVYKSVNGGANWNKEGLDGVVQALALDPTSPSTIYAGSLTGAPNAFVAKIG